MTDPRPESSPTAATDRRTFLKYVGAGAAALGLAQPEALFPLATTAASSDADRAALDGAWTTRDGLARWTPIDYPVPLPGADWPLAEDATRLARYAVQDALVLPDGWRHDVVAEWGAHYGADGHRVRFGYNCDYTGLTPVNDGSGDFWLFVNHEYVSTRPWYAAYRAGRGPAGETVPPAMTVTVDPDEPLRYKYGRVTIDGWRGGGAESNHRGNRVDVTPGAARDALPANVRKAIHEICDRGLREMGVSVLRVRRTEDGRFHVVDDARDHKRIWSHGQTGRVAGADFRFTGPTAPLLDAAPLGTFANCSGATTPWGTFLTCEENIHHTVPERVTPDGQMLPMQKRLFGGRQERVNGFLEDDDPTPVQFNGLGNGLDAPLDGRHYGWVCEVDPATGAMQKHTGLGRFRHENVTLRCEAGKHLTAYMGEDRRGGHVWKFVSAEVVRDPADPKNSQLLTRGTLYAARFAPDHTGTWVPLTPETPLRRPEPEHCPSHHIHVPARWVGGTVGVGDTDRDEPQLEVDTWTEIISHFAGRPFDRAQLGDLVWPDGPRTPKEPVTKMADDDNDRRARRQGLLLLDASVMANCCGGTPTARPEDLEVHPEDGSVFIAFTDASESGDGSPDRRIFPDADYRNSRQYGAVYRIVERDDDPASTTFTWGRFARSGETAEQGGGFACADNLVFDPHGHLWMVTDISTSVQNFPTARDEVDGTAPGGKYFPGVFGNNAMFMLPTRGPRAGVPHIFALGPMDCELTGPTFTDDGRTLIVAVQHPGEQGGTRTADTADETQTHVVHDRAGRPFEQTRTVPQGSNFPSGDAGEPPRPAVMCITRAAADDARA
ncbi:MAG: alkaline phosphatase PhoX [Acidobacteriota bacterium]